MARRLQPGGEGCEEALHLYGRYGLKQSLPAAGKRTVDGGATAARWTSHVLQAGLGDSPTGDTGKGSLNQPAVMALEHPLCGVGHAQRSHSLRQCPHFVSLSSCLT